MIRLQHLAQREIDAGWQPPVVKFHDFLNALASAKTCKQPESDGVVVEMVTRSQLVNSFVAVFAVPGAFGWLGDRET